MKRICSLAALFLLAFASNAAAQLLFGESFDYDKTRLDSVSAWTSVRSEDNQYEELKNLALKITDNTLDYASQSVPYAGSQVGKALAVDFYASTWVTKHLATSFKRQTKGTVYLAFLFRLDQMPVYGNNVRHATQFTTLGLSDSGTSRGPMLWVRKVEQKEAYRFGATIGSRRAEDVVWDTTEFNAAGRTHLIVLKYDLGAKTGMLFVDPTPGGAEPAQGIVIPTQEGAIRAAGSVFLYFFQPKANQAYSVAGIRVGTRWEDAVAAK